jgi:hypothetical protein
MADIVSGEIDVGAHRCPTCGRELTNGHRIAAAEPPLHAGQLVEVSNPKTPLIVGARIARFVGYLENGSAEVVLGSGEIVTIANARETVRAMPGPLRPPEAER